MKTLNFSPKSFVHSFGFRHLSYWGLLFILITIPSTTWGGDPFGKSAPSRPNNNHSLTNMAFDQVNWKRPQGVFSWITMARGYETPWDSISRPGWMTIEDAYVKPIDPGISEFSTDTEIFYIVFEGQPLDAPGQFAAAWFKVQDGSVTSPDPIGKDVIELEMNQRFGYFEIYQPDEGWRPGAYQVNIFYGSPGQELHAANVVGTMAFTITP